MNDFEKPFRDALTDLEVAPPEGGWSPINAALDRKGFDYRTYGLLLLLLLLTGVGSLVTYHVATHALEQQQRAVAIAARADAAKASSVSSSSAEHTVEVPCANTASPAGASAYTDATLVGGNAGTIDDPRVEKACKPSVDAEGVNERALASNRQSQQRQAVGGDDDDDNAVIASDVSRRVIRRKPRRDVPTTTTQLSAHTSTLTRALDEETYGSKKERGRGSRKNRNLATTTDANKFTPTDREDQLARDGEHATDTAYTRATHVKSPMSAVVPQGEILARESGRDSVIQAYNGPPMPVRNRKTPSADALALVPFESLENIHEEEKATKTLRSDSVEEKKRKERARSKWSLQVQGGANYTFKKMDPARDLYYVTGLNNKNQASWKNAGYQVGATARYTLARRTTMTAGISWNMLREHTSYNYYNIISDSVEVRQVAGKSIEVNGYSKVRTNDVTNTLHYLGAHVGVIQQVKFLRHERNILLGLDVNRQIAATRRTQNSDHRFTVNDMRVSLRAGLEHRIALSQHHLLTLTPFIERSFGSVYSEESVYTLRPIQLGLDVGLVLPFYKRR